MIGVLGWLRDRVISAGHGGMICGWCLIVKYMMVIVGMFIMVADDGNLVDCISVYSCGIH